MKVKQKLPSFSMITFSLSCNSYPLALVSPHLHSPFLSHSCSLAFIFTEQMEDYIMLSGLLLLPPQWLKQLPDLGGVYHSAVWVGLLFVLSSAAICHFLSTSLSAANARRCTSISWTKTNVAIRQTYCDEVMKDTICSVWIGMPLCHVQSRGGAGVVQGACLRISKEVQELYQVVIL